MPTKKPRISVTISQELKSELENRAQQLNIKPSELAAQILEQFFKKKIEQKEFSNLELMLIRNAFEAAILLLDVVESELAKRSDTASLTSNYDNAMQALKLYQDGER